MDEINNWITTNNVLAFYGLMAISFILNRLPFAGVFFRTVNTLLHESGHAIGAIVTSGEVIKIDLNKDTSGVAETKSNGKAGAFITSFAGYPFAAIASSLLLVLAINGQHKLVAFILLSFLLLNLMLFVRNVFGILWILLFSALIIVSVYFADDLLLKLLILFISLIAFTETLASTLLITYLAMTKPKKSGDMANMQKTTGIPAAFWAMVNCFIVLAVLYYTVIHYFPGVEQLAALINK